MADNKAQNNINFNIDPNRVRVLYADSYLIGSNDHVVTLSFGQALPDPTQQNIVSRIALTKGQAKEFLQKLNEHIEKFEV
jgi:hypothetical protein